MTVEIATYLSDLDDTLPDGPTNKIYEGDNHIRLIKQVLQNTFPNLTGAVSVTHTKINYLSNVSSDIQAQLDAITTLADGKIYLGNASNVMAEVTLSGAFTLSNTGVATLAAGGISNSHINAAAAISLSKLASGTANALVGYDSGGLPSEVTRGSWLKNLIDEASVGVGSDYSVTTIPSGTRKVEICFSGIQKSNTARLSLELGSSGPTYVVAGYSGRGGSLAWSTDATLTDSYGASGIVSGRIVLTKLGSTNKWQIKGDFERTDSNGTYTSCGVVDVSAALTAFKFKTSAGTFSAGTVSVDYYN